MEFVDHDEAIELLNEQGIQEFPLGEGQIGLALAGNEVVHLHLACAESTCVPREGAEIVPVERDRLPGAVEQIFHKLHLSQVLVMPVAKWRKVFDAVAFSMADNEDWQAVDAAATLALNGRDPLLCEPPDFHTITALITALLSDADSPDQSLVITTPAAPFVVEIAPDGAARISIGNPVLADEVVEAFSSTR